MLTMRILQDALEAFSPVSHIVDGSAHLSGVLLSPAPSAGLACLYERDGGVCCAHGDDLLFFPNATLAEIANAAALEQKRLSDWRDALDRALDRGGKLQELVELSYPIFQNPIFITDELDRVCAKTGHGFGTVNKEWDYILRHGCMPFERMQGIGETENFRSHWIGEGGPSRPFFFCPPGMEAKAISYRIPSRRRGIYVGALVIIQKESLLTEGTLHISETLADAVTRWTSLGDAETRLQSLDTLFRTALDGGAVAWGDLEKGLRQHGLNAPAYLLAVAPCETTAVASGLARTLESMLDCFCVEAGGRLAALFPESLVSDAESCFEGLSGTLRLRFGLSGVFTRLEALPWSLRQAETALELGKTGVSRFDSRAALSCVCRELRTGYKGMGIAHPAVRTLRSYDEAHGTEYLRTLYVWLRCERSAARCLDELHIHRNTLLYRLERLKALCGEDFSDPDSREHLLLSLRLLDMK